MGLDMMLVPDHQRLLFANGSLPFKNGTRFANGRPFENFFIDCELLTQTVQKRHRHNILPPTIGIFEKVGFANAAGQTICFCKPSATFVLACTVNKNLIVQQIHCFLDTMLPNSQFHCIWRKRC
jgi:hypothetical protein